MDMGSSMYTLHTGGLRHRLVSTDGNKPLGDEDDQAAIYKRKKQLPNLSEKSRQSVRMGYSLRHGNTFINQTSISYN